MANVDSHADRDHATQPVIFEAHVEVHPVGPHVHVIAVIEAPLLKARCSACRCVVSRVITDGLNPAELPKNSVSAEAKSPLNMPCLQVHQRAASRPPSGSCGTTAARSNS